MNQVFIESNNSQSSVLLKFSPHQFRGFNLGTQIKFFQRFPKDVAPKQTTLQKLSFTQTEKPCSEILNSSLSRMCFFEYFRTDENGSVLRLILCGGLGGWGGWLILYPFDVVRNNIMADWKGEAYKGTMDCFKKM